MIKETKASSHQNIIIKNAHTNNLKNINLEIPKHKLVVFTGVSGSGKSSLLFDTIYTEAQRQLIETFSTFARARLPQLSRPDVDDIKNLSTAIVIDQKKMGNNLRSTVGTATEIITYLRLLFSRFGSEFIGPSFLFSFNHPDGMCPECKGLGKKVKVDIHKLINKEKSLNEGAIEHPDFKVGGWRWGELVAIGLFDPDKKLRDYSDEELHKLLYTEAIPINKKIGAGIYSKNFEGIALKMERVIAEKAEDELPDKQKDAYKRYFIYQKCKKCDGTRINEKALAVQINGKNIGQLSRMELTELYGFLQKIKNENAKPVLGKALNLLYHLIEIGVGYLSLERPVSTLSGGESQRVKMARQLDCNLVDLMYILDEPSIGLHPRDNEKLLKLLNVLKNKGNSVFVVEHDPEIIKSAEWIIDIGPKAGQFGGQLVYSGELEGIKNTESITGEFLFKETQTDYLRKVAKDFFEIKGASTNNLKNINVKIPKGVLTCVTGVAGSGKSSLINEHFALQHPEAIKIDQSQIGKSSRANAVTYTGAFDYIRKEFAKASGQNASLFSFNSKGACPKCNGAGYLSLELSFLDDVKTICDQCEGKKYKPEVLEYKYNGKSISEVLALSVRQALKFFEHPQIIKRLNILSEVGLGYLKLGQSLSTLSGGESQRLKLASELHKEGNIYIMDEPTTGLHMSDIDRLSKIIHRLTDKGNTVIIIEHNTEIIKQADWIIDMGPEGGSKGGEVLFSGVADEFKNCERSYTQRYI